MSNKKKKSLIIELSYLLVSIVVLIIFKNINALNTIYDTGIFAIILILLIFIVLFLPTPINKIFSSIYLLFTINYIDYIKDFFINNGYYPSYDGFSFKYLFKINILSISILVILVIFILMYLKYQKKVTSFSKEMKYRLFSILLLYLLPLCTRMYNHQIEILKSNSISYKMQESDYYSYIHIEDSERYVDNFGLLSYVYEDLDDYKLNRSKKEASIKNIEEILNNKVKDDRNEYTGILKDKNVILIQSGLLNNYLSDELTPNLMGIRNNSIIVKGFRNPMLTGLNIDTEFMTNTSLIPNSKDNLVNYTNPDNEWGITLPSLFEEDGYTTNFYYGNYSVYHNRKELYSNYGYDNMFFNLDINEDEIVDDLDAAETIAWISGPSSNKNFNYWLPNSSNNNVEVKEENINKVKSLYPDISDGLCNELARLVNFDDAIGKLLKELKSCNALDNTVVVLFSNGCVSDYSKETGVMIDSNLMIYNNEIKAKLYEKTSTSIDILPTLANLFDIEYDENKIIGNDIFDSNYRGFYFNDVVIDNSYWKTDDYIFDYEHGKTIEKYNNVDVYSDIKYKERIIKASHDIIKYNYFK